MMANLDVTYSPRERWWLWTLAVVGALGLNGAFLYGLPGNQISLGLVTGLDYRDPLFDPHAAFQRRHPSSARSINAT